MHFSRAILYVCGAALVINGLVFLLIGGEARDSSKVLLHWRSLLLIVTAVLPKVQSVLSSVSIITTPGKVMYWAAYLHAWESLFCSIHRLSTGSQCKTFFQTETRFCANFLGYYHNRAITQWLDA